MNLLILAYILSTAVLKLCTSQDYASPTYNPDIQQTNPTNDYLNPDPKYDNPYDPRRRKQNRNQDPTQQYDPNQPYDPNRSQYDPNRSQYDPNRNQYDPNRNQYDPNRSQYDINRSPDQRFNQFENRNPDYNVNQYSPANTPAPSYNTAYRGAPLEHDSVIINEA